MRGMDLQAPGALAGFAPEIAAHTEVTSVNKAELVGRALEPHLADLQQSESAEELLEQVSRHMTQGVFESLTLIGNVVYVATASDQTSTDGLNPVWAFRDQPAASAFAHTLQELCALAGRPLSTNRVSSRGA